MSEGTWLKEPATLCELIHEARLFFGLYTDEGMIKLVEAIRMYHNAKMYQHAAEVARHANIDYKVVNE